mmetsp:Transcript_8869/g.39264  ORF Transcript_8869/g.39264 Transcript_8869/m.39264 type:complete len:83 (+) Transcript_8869:500-748(+)
MVEEMEVVVQVQQVALPVVAAEAFLTVVVEAAEEVVGHQNMTPLLPAPAAVVAATVVTLPALEPQPVEEVEQGLHRSRNASF